MLTLKNISKIYKTGDLEQKALDGVSVSFRKNEFISILGQSGGGKTTLLNIIGGLAQYTSGDLLINGKSTKSFKDSDWDYYRNVSVGFVFQSYNLISHQSILKNVELALTLSGVKSKEREERAKKALEDVGLKDHIYKKPNQLSGGQMQRVAIARALVNNPDIILADEPTGALDSNTSLQIMEILKEIAKRKLVIMVTHNPDLAQKYSTRIVKIKDGKILDDSNPYDTSGQEDTFKTKKIKLGLKTALGLSFNNLLTKKARTLLTAFAGSIGIIGIALILALSNGVNDFIIESQRKTLKSYPIQIQEQTFDLGDSFAAPTNTEVNHKDKNIYSNDSILERRSTMTSSIAENNLTPFKAYLEKHKDKLNEYVGDNSITYLYDMNFDIFTKDSNGEIVNTDGSDFEKNENAMGNFMQVFYNTGTNPSFKQLITDKDGNISKIITEEYELVEGAWPKEADELVLFTDSNQEINTIDLYNLGLLPKNDYEDIIYKIDNGEDIELEQKSINPKDILGHEFSVVSYSDYYEKDGDKFISIKDDQEKVDKLIENGQKFKITAIAKKIDTDNDDNLISAPLGYTEKFTDLMIDYASNSEVAKAQKENPDKNVLNNVNFKAKDDKEKEAHSKLYLENLNENENLQVTSFLMRQKPELAEEASKQAQQAAINSQNIENLQAEENNQNSLVDFFLQNPDSETLLKIYDEFLDKKSYNSNLEDFGLISKEAPNQIDIYVENFDNRENVKELIKDYNEQAKENEEIAFTDFVGLMTSSIRTIINAITYVLIAFVGVSLVVSSIMIGIITYISVLERTKEIGILRSIGASKGDISKVFMSETFIIGFLSGLIGIVVTIILTIPISSIIQNVTGIDYIRASLPPQAAILLIFISVVLTLIAGIIPSRIAAKKDPVEALSAE